MTTKLGLGLVVTALLALAGACGDDSTNGTDAGTAGMDSGGGGTDAGGGGARMASIVDCAGVTAAATIEWRLAARALTNTAHAGDVLKWHLADGAATHTVTSGAPPTGDGLFDSGRTAPGSDVCVRFDAVGSYPYFCSVHNAMTGTVTIE